MNIVLKLIVLNRYCRITRFYAFLKDISIKAGIVLGAFMAVYFLFDSFVLDTKILFDYTVENFKAVYIFLVFIVSEILMGIVPPELFIAWGLKTINPWLFMFFLATLSYITGIFAYALGSLLNRLPWMKNYIDRKAANHVSNLRRWGGLFIFAGAMLPLPHVLVGLSSGIIKYRFRQYMLWALFRFARFFIFAVVMAQIF